MTAINVNLNVDLAKAMSKAIRKMSPDSPGFDNMVEMSLSTERALMEVPTDDDETLAWKLDQFSVYIGDVSEEEATLRKVAVLIGDLQRYIARYRVQH